MRPMARRMATMDLITVDVGGFPQRAQTNVNHDPNMAEKIRLNTTSTVAVSEISREMMKATKPKVNQTLNR